MTKDEIMAAADMAEKFPGANQLNFGELAFDVLAAWVQQHPGPNAMPTGNFDVESVKDMFERWWKVQNARARRKALKQEGTR